eukprot:m.84360 g.84360  ORF g.84360 m.84360 type:complete len:410 (-) comp12962_c0_seq2:829-2058(-)
MILIARAPLGLNAKGALELVRTQLWMAQTKAIGLIGNDCRFNLAHPISRFFSSTYRCLLGFYKRYCMLATCRKTSNEFIAQKGVIVDRRSTHMCNMTDDSKTSALESRNYSVSDVSMSLIFTVSNGHVGSKFLAKETLWNEVALSKQQRSTVETRHEHFPSNLAVTQLPIHPNYCSIAKLYIRLKWVSGILQSTNMSSKSTFFDSGHLVSLSLFPAFHSYFGSRRQVKFVRLRRNRIDLAWSKAVSSTSKTSNQKLGASRAFRTAGGPCSEKCTWCLCPLDAATMCLPPGKLWSQLTFFQQFLWEIDELECQWQKFLLARAELDLPVDYLDVDWDTEITTKHIASIADFINIGEINRTAAQQYILQNKAVNQHVNSTTQKNISELLTQDKEYRILLGATNCDTYTCSFG